MEEFISMNRSTWRHVLQHELVAAHLKHYARARRKDSSHVAGVQLGARLAAFALFVDPDELVL